MLMSSVIRPGSSSFEAWASRFGRVYTTAAEESTRRAVFAENLAYIRAVNADERSYRLGLGPFADLTADEWRAAVLLRTDFA